MRPAELRALLVETAADWNDLQLAELLFWHRSEARLILVALLALAMFLLTARWAFRSASRRQGVLLPALLKSLPSSRRALLRHTPMLLFVAGLPFFALALADPFSALVRTQDTHPGRRIGVMIDASTSMARPFTKAGAGPRMTEATFFKTVEAAEAFVRLRMKSKNRDLLALVEFGNRAYVVTPFTSDYDNILVSTSLIGDPAEYSNFPSPGTVIGAAIHESIQLYKAFDFLDAAGNLMVIFTDGDDVRAVVENMKLDEIMAEAIQAKIPVYFVRINYGRQKGQVIADELWIPAIAKTGGKFYAASDERTLMAAIRDINRVAEGTIEVRQYTTQRPKFAVFALLAAACWTTAAALKLGVPYFQKLP